MKIKQTIDAKGLTCPVPLLKARQGLSQLAPGEQLEIFTTDPSTIRDFPKMAKLTANTLVSFQEEKNGYRFVLQKG